MFRVLLAQAGTQCFYKATQARKRNATVKRSREESDINDDTTLTATSSTISEATNSTGPAATSSIISAATSSTTPTATSSSNLQSTSSFGGHPPISPARHLEEIKLLTDLPPTRATRLLTISLAPHLKLGLQLNPSHTHASRMVLLALARRPTEIHQTQVAKTMLNILQCLQSRSSCSSALPKPEHRTRRLSLVKGKDF